MTTLEVVLIAINLLTITLLAISVRSTTRWITAYNENDRVAKRYASKQETVKIRNENGGW